MTVSTPYLPPFFDNFKSILTPDDDARAEQNFRLPELNFDLHSKYVIGFTVACWEISKPGSLFRKGQKFKKLKIWEDTMGQI